MDNFKSRWLDWKPKTGISEVSKDASPTPSKSNTPRYVTDRTDKSPSVSFVSPMVGHISSETPDLKDVVLTHDGTDDEHMNTEPFGLPKWISAIEEFNVVERGHLREVFHYTGCIHDSGRCPDDAQVVCTNCEDHTHPYD
jgi:hypothetical protein